MNHDAAAARSREKTCQNSTKVNFYRPKTRPVTSKKRRFKNQTTVTDRMANSKTKGKTVINSKKAANHYRRGDEIFLNNQTESSRASSIKIRCHMIISLVLNPINGRWFLHDTTNLEHTFHYGIPPKASVLNVTVLSKDKEA